MRKHGTIEQKSLNSEIKSKKSHNLSPLLIFPFETTCFSHFLIYLVRKKYYSESIKYTYLCKNERSEIKSGQKNKY